MSRALVTSQAWGGFERRRWGADSWKMFSCFVSILSAPIIMTSSHLIARHDPVWGCFVLDKSVNQYRGPVSLATWEEPRLTFENTVRKCKKSFFFYNIEGWSNTLYEKISVLFKKKNNIYGLWYWHLEIVFCLLAVQKVPISTFSLSENVSNQSYMYRNIC